MDGKIIWYYLGSSKYTSTYDGICSMAHYTDLEGLTIGLYKNYYALAVL